jgi:hypothetical protein
MIYKSLLLITLALAGCSSNPPQTKPMLLKANFVFSDSVESASYCLLKRFDEKYKTLGSSVQKTDKGYDIKLKVDGKLKEIISLTRHGDTESSGEVFLREGDITTQSWIDRTTKAALDCKGRMTY